MGKVIFWGFIILMCLGLLGGYSQGNLPFQNGNGIHGAPAGAP